MTTVYATTTPNDNIGYYTEGLPEVQSPLGTVKIPLDVPNADGVNPATAFIYGGALLAGLPLVEDRFYGVPRGATPGTLLTVTATLYAYPFFIPNSVDIQTIALSTTSGQTGGAGHVGIYADDGTGYPGELIADSGALIATSGAAVQTYTPTAAISLPPGWYWMASIFTASSTYPTVSSVATGYGCINNSLLGSDTAAHLLATSAEAAMGITVAGTYGALPSTFTAGGALRLNADVPLVILGT